MDTRRTCLSSFNALACSKAGFEYVMQHAKTCFSHYLTFVINLHLISNFSEKLNFLCKLTF